MDHKGNLVEHSEHFIGRVLNDMNMDSEEEEEEEDLTIKQKSENNAKIAIGGGNAHNDGHDDHDGHDDQNDNDDSDNKPEPDLVDMTDDVTDDGVSEIDINVVPLLGSLCLWSISGRHKVNSRAALVAELKKVKAKCPMWCAANQSSSIHEDVPYGSKLNDPVWGYTTADAEMLDKRIESSVKQEWLFQLESKSRRRDNEYLREVNRAVYEDPAVKPDEGTEEFYRAAENYALYGKESASVADDGDGDEAALIKSKHPSVCHPAAVDDDEDDDDDVVDDDDEDEDGDGDGDEDDEEGDEGERFTDIDDQSEEDAADQNVETEFDQNGFNVDNNNNNNNNCGGNNGLNGLYPTTSTQPVVQDTASSSSYLNYGYSNVNFGFKQTANNSPINSASYYHMYQQQTQQNLHRQTSTGAAAVAGGQSPSANNFSGLFRPGMSFIPQMQSTSAAASSLVFNQSGSSANFLSNSLAASAALASNAAGLVYTNPMLTTTTQHYLNTFFKETQYLSTANAQGQGTATTTTSIFERLIYAQMLQQQIFHQTQQQAAAVAAIFQQKVAAAAAIGGPRPTVGQRAGGCSSGNGGVPASFFGFTMPSSNIPPPPGLTLCGRHSSTGPDAPSANIGGGTAAAAAAAAGAAAPPTSTPVLGSTNPFATSSPPMPSISIDDGASATVVPSVGE